MANKPVDMSKLKQVLRLFKNGDLSNRKIADAVELDKNRVMELALSRLSSRFSPSYFHQIIRSEATTTEPAV